MSEENNVCEWCGDWILGGNHYFNLSDGEYGYFCSRRCASDAGNNGYYGSKHSDCFITTAVCEAHGLGPDCKQLQALREFRDRHMATSHEKRDLLMHYYDIAPGVVSEINASSESGVSQLSNDIEYYLIRQ